MMGTRSASDDQLMRELRARRRWALEALVERHQSALFGLALQMLNDRAAAEEVVVECFLALWRGDAVPAPSGGEVRAWLLACVRDAAAQRLGPARGEGSTLPRSVPAAPSRSGGLDDLPGTAGQSRAVRLALARLPPPQREAVILAYFGGLTVEAIAARLGVSRGAVLHLLNGGIEQLRTLLASPLEEHSP